jgi:CRISPR-associated Csx2 family protein
MRHTLVTFLGKGRDNVTTGYREAIYRFEDGRERRTAFFGLALAEHLNPETLVILGTRGSQWGVLVENLAAASEEEDARLSLMEAETCASVDQPMLDAVTPLLCRALARPVMPRLIPYGREAGEQNEILQKIADVVPRAAVSFDLTHGFRHLGMVGFLSAFMLERIGRMRVRGLWYGAVDMSEDGVAPVIRLDGLSAVQRWIDALDRFDAGGDYGVFSDLLAADGVPADKAECLKAAAFHERNFNLPDAARKLNTFLSATEQPLPGASGLFQERLRERLAWARAGGLADYQRQLAYQYLGRADFVRAAIFGWEAVVTKECEARGCDVQDFRGREDAYRELEDELQQDLPPSSKSQSYWTLKHLRNALAHGGPPSVKRYRRMLQEPQSLATELERSLTQLLG